MKSIVLLSGGLDSTYNLHQAHRHSQVLLALTFDYGQKAAPAEIRCCQTLCERMQTPHKVVPVPWLKEITQSSLVHAAQKVPQGADIDLHSAEKSAQSARAVWVPNRNGVFLNIAASFAEALGAHWVIPGFNKEEAQTFADNSADFLASLERSFSFSTRSQVKPQCFSTHLDKTDIVLELLRLNISLDGIWPCYLGGAEPCHQCESCQRFDRAVRQAKEKMI